MLITATSAFIKDIYLKRKLVYELAKRDFQQQYMGSYLGFIWMFLQPLMFITVLYMVFTLGFRTGSSTDGVPFVVYLVSGLIAWFFIAQNLSSGCNTITSYSFLLKKIDFRLSILPVVKIISSTVSHVFFILLAIIVAWVNGFPPSIYTLQIFYYLFSMVMLLLGFGWLSSSTNVFVNDVSKVISIMVQFGFWLTPIFWNISRIPEDYHWVIKMNPAYYIIAGYRDSLFNHVWFWEKPYETIFYWAGTVLLLLVGITVFKKLKPHFAEVI